MYEIIVREPNLNDWAFDVALPTLRSIAKVAEFHQVQAGTCDDRKRFEAIKERALRAIDSLPAKIE